MLSRNLARKMVIFAQRVIFAQCWGYGRRSRTIRSRGPGPRGRRLEPRLISARGVGGPLASPPTKVPATLQVRGPRGAAEIAPGPLPFRERPCGALLRCASGQGKSSRVCVARAAPVTPSSSSRNRRRLPALLDAPLMRAPPGPSLRVGPRQQGRGDRRSPERGSRGSLLSEPPPLPRASH